MTNPAMLLPAKARATVYSVLIFLGLAVGAAQTGFRAAGALDPTWLTVAAEVVPYLTAAMGFAALTHTPREDGEVEVELPEGYDVPEYDAEADSYTGKHRAEEG